MLLALDPRRALFAAAALCAGCQASASDEPGHIATAIVNGDVDMENEYEAVVALTFRGKQFCTGTVIAPRTVVTAAHCLPPNVDVTLDEIDIFVGGTVGEAGGSLLGVESGMANPHWTVDGVANDIGILSLVADAPVSPMRFSFSEFSTAGLVGQTVSAVGFGITEVDGTGNGIRRSGELVVDRYDASSIYLRPGPSSTCNGDSGGALVIEEHGEPVLIGIHSRSDCSQAIISERVDVHALGFIQPFVEAHEGAATCEEDGLCAAGCENPDPDCPCAADGMCTSACGYPVADLDCNPNACPADGLCDASCEYDFDCECEDGSCLGECAPDDAECRGQSEAGCSVGGDGSAGAGLLLLVVALVVRRRRR